MFEWASENIKNITFVFVSVEDIAMHEKTYELEKRYASANTISGTRSHHSFVPMSQQKLKMKRISQDAMFTEVSVHVGQPSTDSYHPNDSTNFQPGKYIACIYDEDWFIGNIVERSEEHGDVYVKFMRRKNNILSWPSDREQIPCWVPFQHVVCCIDVPEIYGRSARQYKLAEKDYDKIIALLPQFVQ